MSPPLESLSIAQLFAYLNVSRCASIGTFALLVYDYLLTFGDEVRLVWPAEWTVVKVLFLTVRYTTPAVVAVNLLSMSDLVPYLPASCVLIAIVLSCRLWFGFSISFQLLSFTMINALTAIRVIVIWNRKRSIEILVWSALVAQTAVTAVLVARALQSWLRMALPPLYQGATLTGNFGVATAVYIPEPVHVCYADRPDAMWSIWIPPVVYEFFIVVLTSVKTVRNIRAKDCPTLRTVARDGLSYFAILFLGRFFNLLLWLLAPIPLLLMGMHCAWALVTITCNRLFLNLKDIGANDGWEEGDEFHFEMMAV